MKQEKPVRQKRVKLFENGKVNINIDIDIHEKLKDAAKEKNLYPSQLLHEILKNYFKEDQ